MNGCLMKQIPMKSLIMKLLVICLAAGICGTVGGVLFSLCFYSFVPQYRLPDILSDDTAANMHFRFWMAFIVGAVIGIVWSWKAVKDIKL